MLFSVYYDYSVRNCVAAIGAMRFSVRSFGCALFVLQNLHQRRNDMKKILSILLMAVMAVSASMFGGCSGSISDTETNAAASGGANLKAIDFKEAVNIVVSGYNGSGYAEVTIDNGKMEDLLDDEDASTSFSLIGSLDIAKIENNGNLSNGDKIKIKVKYSDSLFEKANLTVANNEFEYEPKSAKLKAEN